MSENKCKILVCCHKQDVYAKAEPYFPIQVGKALASVDLGIQGDDSGDNISGKNASYCELTGMYWAWKNLKDVDVIGLCHYRRYFDFHNQCRSIVPYTSFPTSSFGTVDFSVPECIVRKARSGSVYVAKPLNYRYNLMVEYCVRHVSDDLRILRQVIRDTQPDEVVEAFSRLFFQGNKLSPYNMFFMSMEKFDAYCSWLFPVLEEVERRVDISHYNARQKRIFGYMAERLLNVWLYAYDNDVVELPVIWFTDEYEPMRYYTPVRYWMRSLLNNASFSLLRQKSYEL